MRYLVKVGGIILSAIFAASMVLSATASAAKPIVEHCVSGATGTKWTTGQCTTASGSGSFGWAELTGTEAGRAKGSLRIVDRETVVGVSEVECWGESVGIAGPGKVGRTTEVKVETKNCRGIKNCEKVEAIEARNLPWSGEIFQTEGKPKAKLASGTGGEPGWKVTCKLIINFTDECVQVAGTHETATLVNEVTGSELLVRGTPDSVAKAKCTQSGKESGEVTGKGAALLSSGAASRIT
jgi:hypothetical protein